jgi:hypothetical protein
LKSDSILKCIDIQTDDDDDDEDDDDIAFNYHVNPLLISYYLVPTALKHELSQIRVVPLCAMKLCGGV